MSFRGLLLSLNSMRAEITTMGNSTLQPAAEENNLMKQMDAHSTPRLQVQSAFNWLPLIFKLNSYFTTSKSDLRVLKERRSKNGFSIRALKRFFLTAAQCLKMTENVSLEFFLLGILNQFFVLSSNTVWPQTAVFQKLVKMERVLFLSATIVILFSYLKLRSILKLNFWARRRIVWRV